MKEYNGAVFFVDMLGVGALTSGKVPINQQDFEAHKFRYPNGGSHHQFCAKLLSKFRRVLINAGDNYKSLKVAQLSGCAFIWSKDVDQVISAAKEIMWKTISSGVLCRAGLAYGEIVEPDTERVALGKFICGGAVTKAVKLEGLGKGARVFVDDSVTSCSPYRELFEDYRNPFDGTIIKEFLWYLCPPKTNLDKFKESFAHDLERSNVVVEMARVLYLLMCSDKYRWNATSNAGKIQLASSIDFISHAAERFSGSGSLHISYKKAMMLLDDRDEKKADGYISNVLEDVGFVLNKRYKNKINRWK